MTGTCRAASRNGTISTSPSSGTGGNAMLCLVKILVILTTAVFDRNYDTKSEDRVRRRLFTFRLDEVSTMARQTCTWIQIVTAHLRTTLALRYWARILMFTADQPLVQYKRCLPRYLQGLGIHSIKTLSFYKFLHRWDNLYSYWNDPCIGFYVKLSMSITELYMSAISFSCVQVRKVLKVNEMVLKGCYLRRLLDTIPIAIGQEC